MPEAPLALPQRLSGTERGLRSAKGSPGSGRLAARFSHRADPMPPRDLIRPLLASLTALLLLLGSAAPAWADFVLPPLPYASDVPDQVINPRIWPTMSSTASSCSSLSWPMGWGRAPRAFQSNDLIW